MKGKAEMSDEQVKFSASGRVYVNLMFPSSAYFCVARLVYIFREFPPCSTEQTSAYLYRQFIGNPVKFENNVITKYLY